MQELPQNDAAELEHDAQAPLSRERMQHLLEGDAHARIVRVGALGGAHGVRKRDTELQQGVMRATRRRGGHDESSTHHPWRAMRIRKHTRGACYVSIGGVV